MSEPPKKKANNDGVPAPTTSRGSRFADKLTKLINICTDLKNDSAGALDYEETVKENAKLKSTLEKCNDEVNTRKAEVENLKRSVSDNLDIYVKKCHGYDARLKEGDSWKSSLDETREELDKTKKQLERLKAERKQLEKKALDDEAALKRAKRELSETQRERDGLKDSLETMQEKISFYREDLLVARDPDDVEELFQDFAHKCHRVLMECFCYCDAPPQNITPLETYLENCDGRLATTTIPLSRSTSRPAKLMRCAAAELVVINAMVKHIFTDVYVPGAGTRQSAVSAALELLSRNPQRAAIVRCQLLAEFEIQSETFHSVAQAASNEVHAALDSLFPAGDPRQTFQTKLAELLKDAFKLWQNVQTSSERVVAKLAFDAQIADRMEDSYSDYDAGSAGEAGTPGSPTSTGVPAVQILFPMIRMGGETIFNPKVLWSDQAAFVEAGNELAAGNRTSIYGSGIGASDATRQQVPRRRNSIRGTQMPVARALQPPGPAVNTNVPSSHQIPGPNRGSENGIKATGGNR